MNLPSPSALPSDGFAIGDLRRAGAGVDFKFALEAVHDDFQMQFAHARNDKLAGVLVGKAAEGGVFLRQALQAFAQFLAVRLCFRLDRHADDRLGESGRLEHHIEFLVAQRVARGDVAQPDQGRDVARKHLVHVLAFAALNDHEAADPFAPARARIVNDVALFETGRCKRGKTPVSRHRHPSTA